jgi:transposase
MTQYSDKFKKSLIAKILPPNNMDIAELAKDTGIPYSTLYTWRSKYKKMAGTNDTDNNIHKRLSGEEKLAIVIETAVMTESELSEYCRCKGLYPNQIKAWRDTCVQANELRTPSKDRKKIKQQNSDIKRLEKELRRKEKALAEAAALLILKKKGQEIWGDPEDEKSK